MKFDYSEKNEPKMEPCAVLYKFDGGPEQCLAVRSQGGKKVWFYSNSMPSIQGEDWGSSDEEIKRFYPGDSITITF